jgi:acetylornithine/N-succinyldiaminopimelate aminotransferase
VIDAVMPTYGRYNLTFEKGEGPYLFTADGKRYLDFGGGIAVTALGHCHPHLVKALQDQAGALWHTSNLYHIPGQTKLAQRLVDNTFADSVFFCNSGLEAVEGCLKMARHYHDDNGSPERFRIITCEGAFHGRSLATIAAGRQEKHLAGFEPMVEGFDQVPFGNLNEMRNAIGEETAAILVEPVQGEGGIIPAHLDYLKGLRQTADEFGVLLIFDEVQCGMGRTGKLFAHEWAGVQPDVMAVAKALGGGMPIGAVMATEKAAASLPAGSHGSTFGGNPLAVAAANAVLDVMLADGFMADVDGKARKLWKRLEELAAANPGVIEEVRGAGMMMGLKCVVPNADFINKAHENGLLLVPAADNVARLLPPLIIDDGHIDEALAILETCSQELETG